jgi:hypothetical protein
MIIFIQKSLIQYIRGEGIELFDKPKIPEQEENNHTIPNRNTKLNDKNENTSSKRNFETDKEWLEYCEWLNKLCTNAVDHFLRGIQIGIIRFYYFSFITVIHLISIYD